MAVALILERSVWDQSTISLRLRVWRAFPIVEVYPYSITNPMFLLLNILSCKYDYFLTYRGLYYYYNYLCSLTRTQHTHTHTHMHAHIYMCVCVCVCVCIQIYEFSDYYNYYYHYCNQTNVCVYINYINSVKWNSHFFIEWLSYFSFEFI